MKIFKYFNQPEAVKTEDLLNFNLIIFNLTVYSHCQIINIINIYWNVFIFIFRYFTSLIQLPYSDFYNNVVLCVPFLKYCVWNS